MNLTNKNNQNRWIHWQIWLRSVAGQLTLLSVVLVGALILAIVLMFLRESLFERYVREVYPTLEGWAEGVTQRLISPNLKDSDLNHLREEFNQRFSPPAPTNLSKTSQEPIKGKDIHIDLERIYGAWISNADLDPTRQLPLRLTKLRREWVLQRLRRTQIIGSPEQRSRALEWMQSIVMDPDCRESVLELARYVCRRAKARQEAELVQRAMAVLNEGSGRRSHGVAVQP